MIKIITIIGARPQIIKASAISRAIKNEFDSIFQEIIVHTGQHYDANMSEIFFDELQIPKPIICLIYCKGWNIAHAQINYGQINMTFLSIFFC